MSPPQRGPTTYLNTTLTPSHISYNFSTLLFLESLESPRARCNKDPAEPKTDYLQMESHSKLFQIKTVTYEPGEGTLFSP